jgi:MOSC domain-containing protein YiiM
MAIEGIIYQINIKPETEGERGLPKLSIYSARVLWGGLDGDFNRFREEKKHERKKYQDKAVLLMPLETIQDLNPGWPIRPGHLGENITTEGIDYMDFSPGDRYKLGESLIEITEQAQPCKNLQVLPYVDKNYLPFISMMLGQRGWYAKVIEEGEIKRGDQILQIS